MTEHMSSKRLDSEEYNLVMYKNGAKFGSPVQVTVKVRGKASQKVLSKTPNPEP
jgi:hypothetical protein